MDLADPVDATRIVGATSAAHDGELPLTVWLRGDEAYVPDFTLDAEQVMGELGIRRSRLTQISGKELRVGRIRRGRVVVAVYRPEDVATYKTWTRATASHVKSSAVLNEAAASLRDEGSRVAGAIEDLGQSLAASTNQAVRGGVAEILRALHDPLTTLVASLAGEAAAKQHALERTQAQLTAQAAQLAALEQKLDLQASAMMILTRELAELSSLARLAREDAAADRVQYGASWDDVRARLDQMAAADAAAKAQVPKARRDQAGARQLARAKERDRACASDESSPRPSPRRPSRSYPAARRRPLA